MKIGFSITARMKSTRLPLKVLRLINGKPMIDHLIERIKTTRGVDKVIMCTSTNPQDEILVDYAQREEICWFRGSENDVLKRLYHAARKFDIDFLLSTTADNPLTDPVFAHKMIEKYNNTGADFITALDLPIGTFSYGIKVDAIQHVLNEKKKEDTEIWGHYFYNSDEYIKEKIEVDNNLKKPYRLTVDNPEDLEVIRRIYMHFQNMERDDLFNVYDIVSFLDNRPDIVSINSNISQKFNDEEENIL